MEKNNTIQITEDGQLSDRLTKRRKYIMKTIISMLVSVMMASIMVMPIHAESNGRKVGNVTTWALEKSLIL